MESATPAALIAAMTDDDIQSQIDLIEENMVEAGRRSSYAERNRPLLRRLRIEADKRGI